MCPKASNSRFSEGGHFSETHRFLKSVSLFYPQGNMSQLKTRIVGGAVNTVPSKANSNDLIHIEKQSVIDALKHGDDTLCKGVASVPHANFIERLVGLCKMIVPFALPVPRKLTEAKVPRVEIKSTDTKDIRHMIDKLNIKTQSFTCNHYRQDEMFYRFEADIGRIYVSEEYKAVEAFYEKVAGLLMSIKKMAIEASKPKQSKGHDSTVRAGIFDDSDDDEFYDDLRPTDLRVYANKVTLEEVNELNRKVTSVNNELIKVSATFDALRCHKCEHIIKEYEITSEIIERLRQELKEEMDLAEQ